MAEFAQGSLPLCYIGNREVQQIASRLQGL